MKRVFIFICLLLQVSILFCSCTRMSLLNKETKSEHEYMADLLEKVINAFDKEDSESLKELFSEAALKKAKNLDENIEYAFELVDGTIISCEGGDSLASESSFDYGKIKTMLTSVSVLKTESEKYKLQIIAYMTDTENPENEGIYSIIVLKDGEDFNYFRKPGIYKPSNSNL